MQDMIAAELTGTLRAVPFEVALLRILAALTLGGLVGAEREWRQKPAGLRTHMLVALAACLYVVVAREIVGMDLLAAGEAMRVDPMNLIQAVTSGVAFLVAGIIITSGGEVRNVTTGASLWLAGAIGLACGAGLIPLAGMATLAVLVVLTALSALVRQDGPPD